MTTSLYLRPDLDQYSSSVEGFALAGTLRPGNVLEEYSGSLYLRGNFGSVTVSQISGDELPVGHTIGVDGDRVVIGWPAYAEQTASIRNPNFDNLLDGWDAGAGWIAASGHITPPFCAAFSEVTGTSVLSSKSRYPIQPGVVINASCRVEQGASAAGNAGAGVALELRDAAGEVIARPSGTMIMSGSNGEVKTSSITYTVPDLPGLATVNIACIGTRKKENLDVWVDDFTWDLKTPAVGVNTETTYSITLRATDQTGRTALWSGKVSVFEPVVVFPARVPSSGSEGIPSGGGVIRVKVRDLANPPPWHTMYHECYNVTGIFAVATRSANGLIFTYTNSGLAVSLDTGITWIRANIQRAMTSYTGPVVYDGKYYWAGSMRSIDGLTFTAAPIPPEYGFTDNRCFVTTSLSTPGYVWIRRLTGSCPILYSTDHGDTWNFVTENASMDSTVAYDGQYLWATLNSTQGRRSLDNGLTWLGVNSATAYSPWYYGGNVLIRKRNGGIGLFLRDPDTMVWSDEINLSTGEPGKLPADPRTGSRDDNSIIGDGKGNWVVRLDTASNWSVMYMYSTDNGSTWSPLIQIPLPERPAVHTGAFSDAIARE